MCNKATEDKIRNVVNQFVKDGYMFTVWDVTAFLRKNGERVRHFETKEVITAMFANSEMGNYIRNVVDVNANPNPFLYLSPACDIGNYDQCWLSNNPSQTGMKDDSTTIPANTTAINQSNGTTVVVPKNTLASVIPPVNKSTAKTYFLSAEGRLNISPELTASIGLNPGNGYEVSKTANGIEVVPSFTGENTVNADGRIRLCKTLIESYFGSADQFNVSSKGQSIEVVPA